MRGTDDRSNQMREFVHCILMECFTREKTCRKNILELKDMEKYRFILNPKENTSEIIKNLMLNYKKERTCKVLAYHGDTSVPKSRTIQEMENYTN